MAVQAIHTAIAEHWCVDEGGFNLPEDGHSVAGSSRSFVTEFEQIILVITVGVLNCSIGEFLK